MTAIFAYVSDDVAFLAADTKRAVPLLPLSTMAMKVHQWSEHVLIAQTGAGEAVSELIATMILWRDRNPELISFSGLVQLFDKLRPCFFKRAVKRSKITVAGTIVVACAAHDRCPAQVATFDFATGTQNSVGVSGSVYADGTDQVQFQSIADIEIAALVQGQDHVQLDRWALSCLTKSIALYPTFVGWPADMTIARTFPAPICVNIRRRVRSSDEPLHDAYTVRLSPSGDARSSSARH